MEDISMAGTVAGEQQDVETGAKVQYPSLKSNSEYREYYIPYCKYQLMYKCREVATV